MNPGKGWDLSFLGRRLALAVVLQDDDSLIVVVDWAGVKVQAVTPVIDPLAAKGVRFMASRIAAKMGAK